LIYSNFKDYVSPEVIQFNAVGFSSDLFSLGAVAFRMMINEDRVMYLESISGKISISLNSILRGKYSTPLIDLVVNLLSPNPKERKNLDEVLEILSNLK
jgi:serine/threonine protein kinase